MTQRTFLDYIGLKRFLVRLKAIIPTKTSELQNDSGYLTQHNPVDSSLSDTSENAVQNKVVKGALDGKSDTGHTHTASEVSGLSTVATSGSYNDLSNTPAIPTKTSELTNDSGFITAQDAYDSALSSTSTNAVQNKVINNALTGKSDTGHSHTVSDISDFPTLSTVATSGSYNDLSNKPTIPTVNNKTLTIQKNGANVATFTSNSSSNVTANITVPTNVSELTNDSGYLTASSNLDSSKLTGTIDIARLPKGALERLVTVADQTARFALTSSDVQLGDTVKQLDTGVMYIVSDESKLSSNDGYTEYTAGSATSVPWSGVTGKPSSYTPSSHTHGSITNDGKLGTASRVLVTDSSKKIAVSSVTSTELGYLSGVTSAIQTQLNGKSDTGHTHSASEVSGLSTVATSGSYDDLSNKPTIPTVNNATLTIQKNGSTVKTFTANASSNVTANITVPTKTSDLTNDSHQTITTDTDTTSAESPAHSGTFTCIDSVTRDSNGHVTKVNTKTITLPSDNNTDTLVAQNYSTANNSYPVVFSNVAGVSSTSNRGNKGTIVNNAIYANPSTGSLYATKLYSGGNEVLTSHQSLSNYSTLANTVKSLSISGKTITVTPGSGSAYTLTTQDTVYTHPTTSGNKHIPSGGSSGQFLGWDSDGTAKWVSNPNSDTKMTQNVSTTNATYPVLLVATADATANQGAKTGIFAKSVKVNPSTNVISASGFSGPLTGNVTGNVTGNCSGSSGSCTGLAAKATGNANGKELTNTIIKGLSISGKTITYTQIDGTTGTLTTQDTNTDTLMTQNVSTTNNKYPILLCPTAEATANQGAKTGIFGANALINPSTGEIISKSTGTGAFRVLGGNYGFFIRNDGSNTYFLMTASGDQYGTWTSARPLTINDSTGVCSINGNAATATKLATARSIALGNELAGSANFDGSGNITVNANAYLSVVGVGNKNNYPYHRFAYFGPITNAYQDAAIRLQVARQCINGGSGILEIEFRTNAANGDGQCDVRWIVRSSKLPVDCIQIGFFKTWGGIYADVFCKSSGAYDSYVIRSMGDGSRGSYERKFTLQDCSEANNTTTSDPLTSVNSYASIAAAGTALHNQAYTDILTATDAGVVETANTCSGNAATASKVVATVANDNTGALVQGTMGSNDCFRIAIGGASNAGWAEIATGDDYNEPIYVRQYQGAFATLKRTATLLDASGNTAFPGTVTATGFSGPLTGNVTGNVSGTAANVTGTVAIANGGTGATTRLNAVKNLTNENVGTGAQHFLTITSNWGKAGYCSVADAKTVLSIPTKTSQLTNDSGFLTSHQSLSNYVTLNGAQTISGAKTFTGGVTLSNTAKMTVNHATVVKGTNPSSTQYWQIFNCDKNGGTWGTNTLSIVEASLDASGKSSIYFRACKNTANSTDNGILAVVYDTANNKTWAECPTPDASSNDTKIATTAWVNSKGYLTSHQSLANYLTKTTNVSEMGRYIDLHYDNATSKYDYDVRLYVDSQGTAAGGGSFKISAATAYAPAPASDANDTRIATTKWVKDRGYLTSHQDLSLYPYKLALKTSSAQYWTYIDLEDTTTYPNGFNDLMDTGKYDVRAVIGTTPNAPSITTAPYIQGILEVEWLRTTEYTSSYKRIIQKFHRVGPTSVYDIFIRRAYLNSSSVWVWADWEQVVTIEDIPKIVFAYASRSAIADAGNGSYKRVSANSLYYCYFVNGSFTVTSTKVSSSGTYELQSGGVSQTPGTDKICGLWIKIA